MAEGHGLPAKAIQNILEPSQPEQLAIQMAPDPGELVKTPGTMHIVCVVGPDRYV
jgi:hypothetical protein